MITTHENNLKCFSKPEGHSSTRLQPTGTVQQRNYSDRSCATDFRVTTSLLLLKRAFGIPLRDQLLMRHADYFSIISNLHFLAHAHHIMINHWFQVTINNLSTL